MQNTIEAPLEPDSFDAFYSAPNLLPPETAQVAVTGFASVSQWFVEFVHQLGYFGIFVMTFIESTFVPIPAEVTMIPAGYLVYQGEMQAGWVMTCAILGTICGSLVNYFIALHYGRWLLIKYGKYLLVTPKKIQKMEEFFNDHGAISTFTGRLLPGLRHYISFPAGLARMNLAKFSLYTGLGGGIWMGILMALGYFIGHEEALIKQYLGRVVMVMIPVMVIALSAYVYFWQRKRRKNKQMTINPSLPE